MSARRSDSLSAAFAGRLTQALRHVQALLPATARDLPAIVGLTPSGVASRPMEAIFAETTRLLVNTCRFYIYGDNVVCAQGEAANGRLISLTCGYQLEQHAPAIVANYCTCCTPTTKDNISHFCPPRNFVANLMARLPTREAFPRIDYYARHPIFVENYQLCTQGYYATSRALVHGPSIEVIPFTPTPCGDILSRLPDHLRELLRQFCFASPADLVAAVAMLLTGLLPTIFVPVGKPIGLVDGNQPGIGKTLLVQVIGVLLDGKVPDLVQYTPDDAELSKKMCANLRQKFCSALLIDNAKTKSGVPVSSPVIEANSTAPEISFRILGESANFTRPNDLLWFLTMNATQVSADIVSRALPIRMYFSGDPASRQFNGLPPLEYARCHRVQILGELVGMIDFWRSQGCPRGRFDHRFVEWAAIIGGIMDVCGFPEFLANRELAAAEFSHELDRLAKLAELVIAASDTKAFHI